MAPSSGGHEVTLAEAARLAGVSLTEVHRAVADGMLRFRVACTPHEVALLCTPDDLAAWRGQPSTGGQGLYDGSAAGMVLDAVEADIAAAEVTTARVAALLEWQAPELDTLRRHMSEQDATSWDRPRTLAALSQSLDRLVEVRTRAHLALWLTRQRLRCAAADLLAVAGQQPVLDQGRPPE